MDDDTRQQIADLKAKGNSREYIAARLNISEWAVRTAGKPEACDAVPVEEALRAQVKRQKRELVSASEQIGNWEMLCDHFAELAARMPVPKLPKLTAKPAKREQEMVVLLSDCHANERWTEAQTDGLSHYDFETFCQLLWYYGQEIIRKAEEDRGKCGLKVLHVDVLGDIYHGVLRVDDEVTNEFPYASGIAATATVLYQWLAMLAGHFDRIEVTCVPGNHGRLHQKTQSKRAVEENMDTLIYLFVKALAGANGTAERIKVSVPNTRIHTLTRLGHRVRLGHGDHIRGGNSIASVPTFGLARENLKAWKQEARRNEGISVVEYGHFHTLARLGEVFMNGALAPMDPYAKDEITASGLPTQWVYYTSAEHAKGEQVDVCLQAGIGQAHGFAYDGAMVGE